MTERQVNALEIAQEAVSELHTAFENTTPIRMACDLLLGLLDMIASEKLPAMPQVGELPKAKEVK